MYISKNLNDKGRVKSYTIHDVSWNDLNLMLQGTGSGVGKSLLVPSDALKEASIELKLSKQGE